MTTPAPYQPIVQKALAVREQVLERLHQGQLVYERDVTTLKYELEILTRINQPGPMARLLTALGAVELQLGHFSAAYDFVMRSLNLYLEAGDHDRVISGYSNLGEVLRLWGKPEEALTHYEKAREMAVQTENWQILALVINNIGMVHLEQHQPDTALELLRQALDYSERAPRNQSVKSTQGESWGGIARASLELNDFDQAWQAAQRASQIAEELNQPVDLGIACRILGIVASQMSPARHTPADVAQYFKRSRELLQVGDAQADYARTLLVEARWWLSKGETALAQQQLAEAETRFETLKLPAEAQAARDLRAQSTAPARTA